MTEDDKPAPTPTERAQARRAERLAAALRDNLKRRKAAARTAVSDKS